MSESLVSIFLEDGGVVLTGILTAFQQQRDKRQKLRIGVAGIVDMRRGLFRNRSIKNRTGKKE